jgi:hypothetical protein
MLAVRNKLRRIAATTMAVVMAAVAMLVATAGQASADSYTPLRYLRNDATKYCLATDFSGSVSTWSGCDGPQRWQFGLLDAYPGTALLRNEATGRCLMQVNWTAVVSGTCDGSIAEYRWRAANGYIWSANTGGYLVTDFSGGVYLHNAAPPSNQRWFWI